MLSLRDVFKIGMYFSEKRLSYKQKKKRLKNTHASETGYFEKRNNKNGF